MKRSKSYTWLSGLLRMRPEEEEWGAVPWVRAEVLQQDRSDSESFTEILVRKSIPNSEVSVSSNQPSNSRSKKISNKKRANESGVETQARARSKKQKAPKKSADLYESDDETPAPRPNKPKSKTLAEKVSSQRSKDLSLPDQQTNVSSGWALDDDSEDDFYTENHAAGLRSVLTRQVPGGKVYRNGQLSGDLFVDLKLYNVADISSIASKDRWEKAVVTLKIQVDSNSPEVSHIKKALKICREHFTEEGTFYRE